VCVATLNLIALHIYLYCKGLTTYEFVLRQRKKEKKRDTDQTMLNSNMEIAKNQVSPINELDYSSSHSVSLQEHNYDP
jgi:hypothetical protein